MIESKTSDDFHKIVVRETPLIDVRAPIEFEKGAFINAVNMPILNDEERRLVGIKYKEEGSENATSLGHELVSGEVKASRIKAWQHFIDTNPDAMIYCFRGGQRSKIAQSWLNESGYPIERLEGGYKAFRNYLLNALEPKNIKVKPIILGGHTGSGKTIILKRFKNFVDLEGIANHRGSSFGGRITAQPSQIDFENNLAYRLLQAEHIGYEYILLEDEGRHVGRRYLPKPLAAYFDRCPLAIVEVSIEERIHITFEEYVKEDQKVYVEAFGQEKGMKNWIVYISDSIKRAKKRLGLERYNRIMEAFNHALVKQYKTGDLKDHEAWITILLKEYYDPMYGYQMDENDKRIVYKGSAEEVTAYLQGFD